MKNFSAVIPEEVYRGPRPQDNDYSGELSSMRSIINLEGDDVAGNEAASLRILRPDVTWRWCPISLADIYIDGFPMSLIDYAVNLIESLPKPVYVHCEHGEDRTGLVIAAFRIRNGMLPKEAYQEALMFGYHALFNQGLDSNFRKLGALI